MQGMQGGARKGAGRKAGVKRQALTIKLPPRLIVWLRTQGFSQGFMVEHALRSTFDVGDEEKPDCFGQWLSGNIAAERDCGTCPADEDKCIAARKKTNEGES